MSTTFLMGYSTALVHALLEDELLEVTEGAEPSVVAFVAGYLAEHRDGQSLISLTARALLACGEVDELYADNERLKEVVDGLGT